MTGLLPARLLAVLQRSSLLVRLYRRLVLDVPPHDASAPAALEYVADAQRRSPDDRPVAVICCGGEQASEELARYFPDYRVAIARTAAPWAALKGVLDELPGFALMIWPGTRPEPLRRYAQGRGSAIFRIAAMGMAPQFKGRAGAMPAAIILSPFGGAGDASERNRVRIESILADHDFATSAQLLEAAARLIEVFRDLRFSSCGANSLASAADVLGPHQTRRVLLIGGSEDRPDSSAPSFDALVALAAAENPGADIVCYPASGTPIARNAAQGGGDDRGGALRFLDRRLGLAEVLCEVDRVYVIDACAGFEALIHGLPVTVLGRPFYAGWGLTDDRAALPGRPHPRSLPELFCAVYLIGTRYLLDAQDPVQALLATMLRATAESARARVARTSTSRFHTGLAGDLARSDAWPVLLRPACLTQLKAAPEPLMDVLPVARMFDACPGIFYQRAMTHLVAGLLLDSSTLPHFVDFARTRLRPDVVQELLDNLARCSEPASGAGQAGAPLDDAVIVRLRELAAAALREREVESAARLFHRLLLGGCLQPEVFTGLAEVARLRFDLDSAVAILRVFNRLQPGWRQGRGWWMQADAEALAHELPAAFRSFTLACLHNLPYVSAAGVLIELARARYGALPYAEALWSAFELASRAHPVVVANTLINFKRADEAERLLRGMQVSEADTLRHSMMLAKALSYQGRLADAKGLLEPIRLGEHGRSAGLIGECLRIASQLDDRDWAERVMRDARDQGIELGEVHPRRFAFADGRLKEAFLSYRLMTARSSFRKLCGARYVLSIAELDRANGARNVVLALFGPGDEIRFASFYGTIAERAGAARLCFSCDPRLLGLLRRHYRELDFVPVARRRSLTTLRDRSAYHGLPVSEIHTYVDAAGWALCESATRVTAVSDLLGDVIEDYASFAGHAYLQADPDRIAAWRSRLASEGGARRLVGISWRSTLATNVRDMHYLDVQALAPLFALQGVQYVNLQYDDCAEELAWIEVHFPGRVIHFDDLDQFNDLEGVAALMCCLDLVVAPATTVVELAGALGCPTLLLSNAHEIRWRRRAGTRQDVWHGSTTHVEADEVGDKGQLVAALCDELRKRGFDDSAPFRGARHASLQ